MLLLFETSAGYALFKVKADKLKDGTQIWDSFTSADKASSIAKLLAFKPFENTTEAVVAATSIIESKLDKSLKTFLKFYKIQNCCKKATVWNILKIISNVS